MGKDPIRPRAAHAAIRIGDDGEAWIEGFRCAACRAVMLDQPLACRACASRTPPEPFRASGRGRVVTWSTVHRSFPGVPTPFVSAIVDLADGLTLKGTLRDIDPEAVRAGLPVALAFDDAGGALAADGGPYVGYHFIGAGETA